MDEVRNAEEALRIIGECIERYEVGFCGKKPKKQQSAEIEEDAE